jgi:hypothetical protein
LDCGAPAPLSNLSGASKTLTIISFSFSTAEMKKMEGESPLEPNTMNIYGSTESRHPEKFISPDFFAMTAIIKRNFLFSALPILKDSCIFPHEEIIVTFAENQKRRIKKNRQDFA